MIRINSISGPRNISTAIMYSFAQRSDTTVMDEPFYAFYLSKTGIVHPGREDVLKSQPQAEDEVLDDIFAQPGPVVFIKNMAHHMAELSQDYSDTFAHLFLIRNPRQIIASYSDVIETPGLRDIGIEYQYELFKKLQDKGESPLVLDSGLLLENPESVLKQVCQRLDLPFEENMLHWPEGPKSYDGVWAPHWYANVHRSSGFQKQATSNRTLPAHLEELNERAQFYYKAMAPFSLHP